MENKKFNINKTKTVEMADGYIEYFDLTKKTKRKSGAPSQIKLSEVKKLVRKMNSLTDNTGIKYGVRAITLEGSAYTTLKGYNDNDVNENDEYNNVENDEKFTSYEKIIVYIKFPFPNY